MKLTIFAATGGIGHQILSGYTEAELEVLADFLHRTTSAGQAAADDLTSH